MLFKELAEKVKTESDTATVKKQICRCVYDTRDAC